MKLARHAVALVLLVPSPAPAPGQSVTTTIRAGTVLDGRGGIVRNRTIVIEGARIVRLEAAGKTATYHLGRFTVLPGGIDTTGARHRKGRITALDGGRASVKMPIPSAAVSGPPRLRRH